jgi:hypothetical protein
MRSETSFSLKGSVGVGFGFGASMLLAGFFVIHSFSTQKLKKARMRSNSLLAVRALILRVSVNAHRTKSGIGQSAIL